MVDIYGEGEMYGERPPSAEELVYGPLEEKTIPEVMNEFPDAFKIDPEAAAAIERGEKTPLQVKEERANALGMTLRDYLTEEQVAKDRAAWNAKMRAQNIEPPKTEKYGYGKYGRVDDLHAQGFKYGDKPPYDWVAPDYSPEGRLDWQNEVFRKIGGNPFTFDVNREIEKATADNVRQIFNETFRGQVRYEDRASMTKKQKDHWQRQLNRFRAAVESDAKVRRDYLKFQYDVGMKYFDDKAETWKAAEKERAKYDNTTVKMTDPKTKTILDVPRKYVEARKAEGLIEGIPIDRDQYKEKDSPDVGDYKNLLDSIMDGFDPANTDKDDKMRPEAKAVINKMLTALNMPTLEEMADKGIDGDVDVDDQKTIFDKLQGLLPEVDWRTAYTGAYTVETEKKPKTGPVAKGKITKETKSSAEVAYNSPEEVRVAYQRGDISADEAKKILMERF